ncbi:MAG: hypothetical protein KME60_29550 [Cyanomargarita calcarea GSE-NOS-MK-12-04C]|jgi:hypothetical protein|uniref:Uncharacterized protein n=1 Tax=Cyanomargarita calcarea GSE-NOS-MK-12-04C TaxID=2839659 RepID=A0A951UW04_9CYAN|nr:hypothetical protein [Cyanomargarita calcarea GSE-NOS-MK-12-04C]
MDLALTDHFCQNIFSCPSNDDIATNAENIRSLMGLATGAMLAVGQIFQQTKDELGKGFKDWAYSNEFVMSDANKLIKLFDYFGENFDALTGVSPLQLLRLLVPSHEESRGVLADLIDECGNVSCADIASICASHKIKRVPTIKSQQATNTEPIVELKMVGNQQGGTGIFRLEVKDHQLASELDTQWKQSSMPAHQWMRFMSSSVRVVQEIASVVLGRNLTHESELDELRKLLFKETTQDLGVVAESIDSEVMLEVDGLPMIVRDCLNKIEELNSKTASLTSPVGTDAMMRRIYREERDSAIASLKLLAVEYEIDLPSLLFRVANMEQTVAVKK